MLFHLPTNLAGDRLTKVPNQFHQTDNARIRQGYSDKNVQPAPLLPHNVILELS